MSRAWDDAGSAYTRHVQEHGYPRDGRSAWCLAWLAAMAAADEREREAAALIQRLLDWGEPESHKSAPQADAEWGSRTGDVLDCPWCAAREFLNALPVPVEGPINLGDALEDGRYEEMAEDRSRRPVEGEPEEETR